MMTQPQHLNSLPRDMPSMIQKAFFWEERYAQAFGSQDEKLRSKHLQAAVSALISN